MRGRESVYPDQLPAGSSGDCKMAMVAYSKDFVMRNYLLRTLGSFVLPQAVWVLVIMAFEFAVFFVLKGFKIAATATVATLIGLVILLNVAVRAVLPFVGMFVVCVAAIGAWLISGTVASFVVFGLIEKYGYNSSLVGLLR